MITQLWKKLFTVLGLGLATMVGSASAQTREINGMIDDLDNIQDAGRTLFKLTDENNDGQISQKEALDAGNLMVGGFFFRADTNGDGVVSQEEAKQSRDSFLNTKPLLRFVIGRIESTRPAKNSSTSPEAVFMGLVDANGDKQLQATEVRQAIATAVQGIFAASDTNRDGLLSPTEVNAAIVGAVKAAEQATFQAADTNGDGQISKEEFTKALTDPANAAFAILDANNDGQLSQQELISAGRILEYQIKKTMVPEPANSLKNLIETGKKPAEVAPVPVIPVPNRNATTTPAPR